MSTPPTSPEQQKPRRHIAKTTTFLAFVCLVGLGGSGFFYHKYQQAQQTVRQESNTQHAELVQTISKTVDLPSETPTIVTVADKSKLSNKALAVRVKNGDLLLVFPKSQRIVIYRPSSKKVINMMGYTTGDTLPQK